MASDEQAVDDDYDTVATLTRSVDQSGQYTHLSDAYERRYIVDSFEESYDDPTSLLEQHPSSIAYADGSSISRRPPMPIPYEDPRDGMNWPPNQKLQPIEVQPYSDSDEDYEDVEFPIVPEKFGRRRTESDVIDVIGSLCLEGVFQGIAEEEEGQSSGMLPSSVRMTDNLVKQGDELDELSVMVTRNLEIVPETPFDANTGTGKSFSVLKAKMSRHSIPKLRLRARSDAPVRPNSVNFNKVVHRPTSVTYYDNIVRPQPLPPLDESLSNEEKKRYRVMESLLESEAAFLTSLNIAIEVYKKPLRRKLQENHAVLEQDQIQSLFGPIRLIQNHHELFYAAISEETKDWSPEKQIGGVFIASFGRKDVIKQYCKYVNNFSIAMKTLETNIKKRQRFLDFLKKQMIQSGTQLSLQALLLKPVQRFPQYLLFLQDLIKYTPSVHEDSVKLQMAQAQMERIADYLNEAKRSAEQLLIVQHLSTKMLKLPFRLADNNRVLLRQDTIQWVGKKSDGSFKVKRRELFLFNSMLICCASKKRKRGQGGDTVLLFKWYCPISKLQVTEADYTQEQSLAPYLSSMNVQESPEADSSFKELRTQLYQLDCDFEKLCKIQSIVLSLYGQYQGFTSQEIHNSIRVIQRKLETVRDQLRNHEPCRVDITIPSKDPLSKTRYHHILVFPSDTIKKEWLRTVHFANLRLSQNNKQTWIMEEEEEEEDKEDGGDIDSDDESTELPSLSASSSMPCNIDDLPLVAEQIKLMGFKNECSSVECAACVGSNRVWLSCSGMDNAQIAVVRCLMPTPMLLETFTIDCQRILCMKAIPASRLPVENSFGSSPSASLHVWLGTSCGKLMLYDATNKTCVKVANLRDSVLCIECYKNRAFVGLANGKVEVYTRIKGDEWDLTQHVHRIPVAESPIHCFCPVDKELWIGVVNCCVIMNMETLRLEHSIKLTSEDGISVRKLTRSSNGVWMALNRGGTLLLYHKDTHNPIQEIDINGSLSNIATCANIKDKFSSLQTSLHISSLLVSSGYLWVGTSLGAVLVYRIPYLHGLPMTTGKPFLAGDGHTDAVRVLMEVHTTLDIPSSRFDQFVSDEKIRKIGSFHVSPKTKSKSSAHVVGKEASDDSKEEERHGLNYSMKIDQSALPIVSDLIKRLERPKGMGRFSPLLTKTRRAPVPKPKVKLKNQLTKSAPSIAITSDSSSTPKPDEQHQITVSQSDDTVDTPVVSKEPVVVDTSVKTVVSDYETPLELHLYDEVPKDDDEGESGLESKSDPDLSRKRYEGSNLLSLGEGLYDDFKYSTISIQIPGLEDRVSSPNQGHIFILTGGRGVVNFRPNVEQISTILNPQNQDLAASSIAFQIPK